jgi:hypothetical protein
LGASYADEDPWGHPEGSKWVGSTIGRYFWNKEVEITDVWSASKKKEADIKALEDSSRAIADELSRTLHPELTALGDRWHTVDPVTGAHAFLGSPGVWSKEENKYTEPPTGDYALAYFELRLKPVPPATEGVGPPAGWTGFEGAYPMSEYYPGQIYGSAHDCLTRWELARRDLDGCTPAELMQAKADMLAYKNLEDWRGVPGSGRMPTGYIIEFYNLAVAQTWSGLMTEARLQHAESMLTVIMVNEILGRAGDPLPGDPGYVPLNPLLNQNWQADLHLARLRGRRTGE